VVVAPVERETEGKKKLLVRSWSQTCSPGRIWRTTPMIKIVGKGCRKRIQGGKVGGRKGDFSYHEMLVEMEEEEEEEEEEEKKIERTILLREKEKAGERIKNGERHA